MKAIVISKESGELLVDLILDSNINPILLSSFVGALSLFGKGNLGKIKEIAIKGLDLDFLIVNKYDLILVAIMDKEFEKDSLKWREEAELALDMFYLSHKDDLENFIDTSVFDPFKKILLLQIKEHLEKIEDLNKEKESKDFGFLKF